MDKNGNYCNKHVLLIAQKLIFIYTIYILYARLVHTQKTERRDYGDLNLE